jgi:hypothetical protein
LSRERTNFHSPKHIYMPRIYNNANGSELEPFL